MLVMFASFDLSSDDAWARSEVAAERLLFPSEHVVVGAFVALQSFVRTV